MANERDDAKWTDGAATQFALAALFLVVAVCWLLLARGQDSFHWLLAISWFGIAAMWAIRAVKSASARRAKTRI